MKKEILKDVNVKIDKHLTVITGSNESGKPTVAKIIADLQ